MGAGMTEPFLKACTLMYRCALMYRSACGGGNTKSLKCMSF